MEDAVMVAVVEDESVISVLLETALVEAGYAVVSAGSVEAAIAMLDTHGASCRALVTDIRLGGKRSLTGWDVARHARERIHNIPVIYTSGDSSLDWMTQGVPKRMMIAKPYAMAQIITAVSQLLNESA